VIHALAALTLALVLTLALASAARLSNFSSTTSARP